MTLGYSHAHHALQATSFAQTACAHQLQPSLRPVPRFRWCSPVLFNCQQLQALFPRAHHLFHLPLHHPILHTNPASCMWTTRTQVMQSIGSASVQCRTCQLQEWWACWMCRLVMYAVLVVYAMFSLHDSLQLLLFWRYMWGCTYMWCAISSSSYSRCPCQTEINGNTTQFPVTRCRWWIF